MQFIDLKTQFQHLEAPIRERMDRVLAHGQYILGPEVAELEQRLADYVGTSHCIAVSSGSDALLAALMALGIGAGDEVITSAFTFIATAEMIALLGARPVFVDIEADTYNIDPNLIEAAITPRTRAIMPVNLFGQCAAFEAINALAADRGLAVIEDAAQSFGATRNGKRSGGLATVGATSFFPAKPLGCYGDGGACFTNDPTLAARMASVRVHGQGERYHHDVIGINGRMDTLQAAILLAKLESFPDEVDARVRIGGRYSAAFAARCPALVVPAIAPGNTSVYAQYTLQCERRSEVLERINARGVPTAVYYPVPLHKQVAFAHLSDVSLPVTEAAAERVFSIPMHPFLEPEQQDLVIDAVVDAVNAG